MPTILRSSLRIWSLVITICLFLTGIPMLSLAEETGVTILSPQQGGFLEYEQPVVVRVKAPAMPIVTVGEATLNGVANTAANAWDFSWTPSTLGTNTITATADGQTDSVSVFVGKTEVKSVWSFSTNSPVGNTSNHYAHFGGSVVSYSANAVMLSGVPSFGISPRGTNGIGLTEGVMVYDFTMAMGVDDDGTQFALDHRNSDGAYERLFTLQDGKIYIPQDGIWRDCYAADDWHSYSVVFDMNAKSYSIYQDGVLLRGGLDLYDGMLDSVDGLIFNCVNNHASSNFNVSFQNMEIRQEVLPQAKITAPVSGEIVEIGQVIEVVIPAIEEGISSVEVFANGVRTGDGVYDAERGTFVAEWIPTEQGSAELIALVHKTDGSILVSETTYVTVMESVVYASCDFTTAFVDGGKTYVPHGKRFWNITAGEIVDETIDGKPVKATKLDATNAAVSMGWQFANRSSLGNDASGTNALITDGILVYEWKMKSPTGGVYIQDRQPDTQTYGPELCLDTNKNFSYVTGKDTYNQVSKANEGWHAYKLVMNTNTWTKSVYLDGACVADEVPVSDENASDAKIAGIWFQAIKGSTLYLADISIRHLQGLLPGETGTVTFTAPVANTTLDCDKATYLKVKASQGVGAVTFYQGTKLLGYGTESPVGSGDFEYVWTPSEPGSVTLTAKTDTGASADITYQVVQYTWPETDVKLDFDDVPTNEEPYGVLADTSLAVTVSRPNNNYVNKVLKVVKRNKEAYIDIPMIASATDMVLSFDYQAVDSNAARSVAMVGLAADNHSMVVSPAFTIGTSGAVTAPDGTSLTTLNNGTMYSFDLLYHFGSKTYDIYLGGNVLKTGLAMTYQDEDGNETSLVFTTPKRLRFTALGGGSYGSTYYLDKIHFYDSATLRDDSVLKTPDPDETWIPAETVTADTETVSQNLNFNDETAGKPSNYVLQCNTGAADSGNKSEIEAYPSATDMSYMIYKAQSRSDSAYVDFAMDTEDAEYTTIEFDMYMTPYSYKKNFYTTKYGKSYFSIEVLDDNRAGCDIVDMSVTAAKSSPSFVFSCAGGGSKTFTGGSWVPVKLVLNNHKLETASLTVNGTVVAQNVPWTNTKMIHPTNLRFEINASTTNRSVIGGCEAKMNIDNLRVYNGNTARTQADLDKVGKGIGGGLTKPASAVTPMLTDAVVLMKESGHAYANGTKTKLAQAAAEWNGVTYVPAEYTINAFGGSVTASGNDLTINIGSNSKTVTAIERNGVKLIPLTVVEELLPSAGITDSKDLSMVIIESTGTTFEKAQAQDIFDFTLYSRPSLSTMQADYNETSTGQHPRLMANASTFARIMSEKDSDDNLSRWYGDVISQAESILTGSHIAPTSDNRFVSLNDSREVLRRAYTLGMAYQLTNDSRYAAWIAEEMRIVSNMAHWEETQTALIMGETAAAVAIAYDWFYDYLSSTATDVKALMEQALYDHALIGAKNCYDLRVGTSTRWVTNEDNINIVVNSGVALAAIAMLDKYPDLAWEMMARAVQSVENGLIGYVPDGVWKEGPSYWSYTTGYLVWMMAAMESAFGTDYGYLSDNPFPQKTGYYNFFMQSARGKNNVGDAGGEIENCEEVFYLASLTNDADLHQLRLDHLALHRGSTSSLEANAKAGTAMDLLFYDASLSTGSHNVALDQKFGDMAIFRDSYATPNPLYATLHAGYNNGTHTHVDAGTFLIDMFDKRWAQERGHDDYTQPNYWHTTKHAYLYRLSTQGQNVLALNPTAELGQKLEATATIEEFVSAAGGGYAVVNMTDVYGTRVKSAKRAIKMDNNRTQVVIQDEIDFRARSTDLYWFMHTFTSAKVRPDGKSVLLVNYDDTTTNNVLMVVDSSDPGFTISTEAEQPLAESGVKPSVGAINGGTRLQIHIPKANGKLTLSVRFIPVPNATEEAINALIQNAPSATPISEWTAE